MGYLRKIESQLRRAERQRRADARAAANRALSRRQRENLVAGKPVVAWDRDFPADFGDALQKKVTVAAVRKGARVVRTAQRKKIRKHQSAKTGSAMLWTDEAKERNAKREGLYKSIRAKVRYDKRTQNVTAFIGPGQYDAWIGWFFEYGVGFAKPRQYWGEQAVDAPDYFPPEPFVRPAGQESEAVVNQKVANHIKTNWEKT